MSNSSSGLYGFGAYRLDAASRLLTRSGVTIALAPKTFDLLVLMVENRARLLTRRELLDALWGDAVVEEASLSFQISTLRKALDDEGSIWIETVPKHGYRFHAPVELMPREAAAGADVLATQPATESSTGAPELKPGSARSRNRRVSWALWGGLAVAGAALLTYQLGGRNSRTEAVYPRLITPITSLPGVELYPSFSPDGNQIAFAWNGEQQDNFDIYVKVAGGGRPLRLSTDARPEVSPAWSPDGRHIAFYRGGDSDGEIVLIPALGGAERIIAKTSDSFTPANPGLGSVYCHRQTLAWFPNSEFLAVVGKKSPASPRAIYELALKTGAARPLTVPLENTWGDDWPSVSPDGRFLTFSRSSTRFWTTENIFSVALGEQTGPAREARRLTTEKSAQVMGLSWAADASSIVYASQGAVWKVAFPGGGAELQPLPGYNAANPAVAKRSSRLAFVHYSADLDIWRIAGPAAAGGRAAQRRLISSTRLDSNPEYSPDGTNVAFTSSREGKMGQIFRSNADGSHLLQLTDFGVDTGSPSWSPDGRYIAFDSLQAGTGDIYIVGAEGGPARRFTLENSHEHVPKWSRDGRWIYFESDRSGRLQLWKAPFPSGAAVQVTDNGGAAPAESPDGRFVWYAKRGEEGLWRRPLIGGEESLVIKRGRPNLWGMFRDGACLLDTSAKPPAIRCLKFSTGDLTTIATLGQDARINEHGPSFSVSPDGQSILYVRIEREESDIMLVENFR